MGIWGAQRASKPYGDFDTIKQPVRAAGADASVASKVGNLMRAEDRLSSGFGRQSQIARRGRFTALLNQSRKPLQVYVEKKIGLCGTYVLKTT